MRILVLQHLNIEPPALVGETLESAGCSLHTLHMDRGDRLPADADDYAGCLVMGGPQSANDTHLPYIRAELDWLAARLYIGMPMLGFCLGSQLMARAAGGSISASPVRELGWYPVYPTDDARHDPVFSFLPPAGQTVFQWHGETFSLPDSASLMATHPDVPAQAFRLRGGQYGMQFHVEVDAPLIDRWVEAGDSEREHLGDTGLDRLHAGTAHHLDPMRMLCRRMVNAWMTTLKP